MQEVDAMPAGHGNYVKLAIIPDQKQGKPRKKQEGEPPLLDTSFVHGQCEYAMEKNKGQS